MQGSAKRSSWSSVAFAVAREVFEESGVRVATATYHSSQPWPFPASLMLGYHAWTDDPTIAVDGEEIVEALWFTREELAAACDRAARDLRLAAAGPLRDLRGTLKLRWDERAGQAGFGGQRGRRVGRRRFGGRWLRGLGGGKRRGEEEERDREEEAIHGFVPCYCYVPFISGAA